MAPPCLGIGPPTIIVQAQPSQTIRVIHSEYEKQSSTHHWLQFGQDGKHALNQF